jgi:hypothetical protein
MHVRVHQPSSIAARSFDVENKALAHEIDEWHATGGEKRDGYGAPVLVGAGRSVCVAHADISTFLRIFDAEHGVAVERFAVFDDVCGRGCDVVVREQDCGVRESLARLECVDVQQAMRSSPFAVGVARVRPHRDVTLRVVGIRDFQHRRRFRRVGAHARVRRLQHACPRNARPQRYCLGRERFSLVSRTGCGGGVVCACAVVWVTV